MNHVIGYFFNGLVRQPGFIGQPTFSTSTIRKLALAIYLDK